MTFFAAGWADYGSLSRQLAVCEPSTLEAGVGEDLVQCVPEAEGAVADSEDGNAHAGPPAVPQQARLPRTPTMRGSRPPSR